MKTSRLTEIDLLRFVTALAIVIYHYSFRGYAADGLSVMPYPALANVAKYAIYSPELFFMISGFVTLMTIQSRTLRDFVVSRAVRLYPAFWVCCTLTFVAIVAIGEPRFSATVGQYLVNMTLMSGYVDVAPIDGVYWYLFVELRFYALVAVVILFRKTHLAEQLLALWLVASIVLVVVPTDHLFLNVLRDLLVVSHSTFFIAGALLYLVWSKGISDARASALLLSWGLALYQCIKNLPEFEQHYSTDMNDVVVGAIVTGYYLVMVLISLKATSFLGNRRWTTIGAVSYPLYLLHANIGFMVFNVAYPELNAHVLLWGTVLAMITACFIIHYTVEDTLSVPLKTAINRSLDAVQRLTARVNGSSGASGK